MSKADEIVRAIADDLIALANGDHRKAQVLAAAYLQDDGSWQCGDGHMFRYEPPPSWPPWCIKVGCQAGNFRWIVRTEVTGRDWLPESDPPLCMQPGFDPEQPGREAEARGFGNPAPRFGATDYAEDWS